MLNFDTYVWLKQRDKLIEWKTKGQAKALRINVFRYNRFMFKYIDHLSCEKDWTYMPRASGSYGQLAGWLADEIQVEFEIFKILYRVYYLDCYFF